MTVDNTQFPATVDSQTSLPKKRQVRTPQGPKTVPVALVEPATNEPAPKSRRASGESSPLIPLLLIGIGGYLCWFAVKYWRGSGPAVWPSYPVKSILQGKGIPANQAATTADVQLSAYEQSAAGAIEGSTPAGTLQSGASGYANPLRGLKGLRPGRIDMGVDYAGAGPVYAVGPGQVTEVDTAWAGGVGAVGPGTFITYRLTAGPLAGKFIYVAENITPGVRVGQQVDTSTAIGQATGQGAGIETGFAAGPSGGLTLAQASGQASASGDPGANTTAYGRAWSDVLHFLGAPAGTQGGPDSGSLPAGWWTGGSGGGQAGLSGKVTPRQVYVAFRQAGIPAAGAVYLTAISAVESGFNTGALNTDAATGDYSVGLTQINYFGGLYAERAPHIGTPQELLAGGLPKQAAATAWLYGQAGLQPWQPDITSGKITGNNPTGTNWLQVAMQAAAGGP